jgi:hypothetical protein
MRRYQLRSGLRSRHHHMPSRLLPTASFGRGAEIGWRGGGDGGSTILPEPVARGLSLACFIYHPASFSSRILCTNQGFFAQTHE